MENLAQPPVVLAVGLLLLASSFATNAQEPPLPQYDGRQHLGVVNCSGSTCHGAARKPFDSSVMMNEYLTWTKEDSHANAYNVLLNDESKRIARNLGLKEDAKDAAICLDCHAHNVPKEKRGPRFQLNEGVTCEACHGGSEKWLGPHYVEGQVNQVSHTDNLALGLYPTEDPKARAKLCLSCHFGTKDKFVTHRIMGAGHPRMSFELDTFTAIQPAHYAVDDDYKKRKGFWSGVQTWAVGQAVAVESFMTNLLDNNRQQQSGLFPELVFFDCYACHHSLNDLRWGSRASAPVGPGVVRLNDSSLLMLTELLQRVDPSLGNQMRQATLDLHRATLQGMPSLQAAARKALGLAQQAQSRLAQHEFTQADMTAILNNLVQAGLKGENRDYVAAEQGAMAIASIVTTLDQQGLLSADQKARYQSATDKIFETLKSDDNYKPQQFMNALKPLSR